MAETPPELVDNSRRYLHSDALNWLGRHRHAPLSVATGYVRVGGLVALAQLPGPEERPVRLLLGAVPEPGLGALPIGLQEPRLAGQAFRETLTKLRGERDFDAFPPSRRTGTLERVEEFVASERVEVRRYTERFLHGKAYIFGELGEPPALAGEGAILVSSANLTSGGLEHNLELGAVRYDPSAIELGLKWFDELWSEAADFKKELLQLLFPPEERYSPHTIFLRALVELYGEEVEGAAGGDIRAGPVTLTRFQEDGYRRARRILEEFGGAIYADGVGTGKTEIGLQFITEYARERGLYTLVIAPAQLRESLWEQRLVEAQLPGEVVSYQELADDRQLSSKSGQRRLHLNKDAYRLIVIDEAHAFRNPDNTWYAALDRLLGGTPKDLIMLTATPVNNSLWDLYNLVLLFARHDAAFGGSRLRILSLKDLFVRAGGRGPEQISEELLFPLVDAVAVRRDRRFLEEHYAHDTFPDGTPVRFPKPLLEEARYDLDSVYPGIFEEVVEGIGALTMARYSPAKYELSGGTEAQQQEALAGLMQSQLLKRFESSVEAARSTLGRMVLAHQALVQSWKEREVVPSLRTLKEMVLATQEGDLLSDIVESAIDEDVEAQAITAFDDRFLTDVEADLGVLRALTERLDHLAALPDPKLDLLADILTRAPAKKVAVFSSYADTARYVSEAINVDPDRFGSRELALVLGIETDSQQRIRALERFAPQSVTGDPDFVPGDGEVDLLIATDILSEGQNLQQAQCVVSYDLPWNPQRVVQRNGRVIRLRSPHERVFLFTMLPAPGALEEALRLEARVRGKIAAANATFGMESQVLSAVEAESKAYADLEDFFSRLAGGDESLLDEGQGPGSGAFAGEQYRRVLSRLLQEGAFASIRSLPWGIGSAFRPGDDLPGKSGVFFACRTTRGDRHWRFVTPEGEIIREDLEMLRIIDPGNAPASDIQSGVDLENAWSRAAQDICARHNALLDPKLTESVLPASQRWALEVLRNPDLPAEEPYNRADQALGVGRNQLVRRGLSELRRTTRLENLSIQVTADRIVDVVDGFGLRPEVPSMERPEPITEEDLGVVCFQVVIGPDG